MKCIQQKTKEKQQTIKELYEEGVKLSHICKITTSSQASVKTALKSFNIDYDESEKIKYKEKLEKVIELYKQGVAQVVIEKELNLTRKTIRELLKEQEGISYRNKSEQWFLRYNTEIDESCFDELTPETCYWIGLLYADGHINKNEAVVELCLHSNDIEHLENFRKFLKCSRKVKKEKINMCRLRFNSKKIHNRLKEFGFTNRKSWDGTPHKDLKDSIDFWRGVVDGDGCLSLVEKRYPVMQLCGTKETIEGFIDIVFKHTGRLKKVGKVKESLLSKSDNFYQVSFYKEALEVADLLYKDATIYLDRKYEIYKKWKDEDEMSEN